MTNTAAPDYITPYRVESNPIILPRHIVSTEAPSHRVLSNTERWALGLGLFIGGVLGVPGCLWLIGTVR